MKKHSPLLVLLSILLLQPAWAESEKAPPKAAPTDNGRPTAAADKGVFVAVGYGGRRMVSTDGKTWEITAEWAQPGGDDSNNLMGLVHAEGKFVAVGGGGGGKTGGGHVLVSTDGRTWKQVLKAKNRINPIVYGDGKFVVGGPGRTLLVSDDAETWTEGAKLDAREATHFRHGAYGNGVFLFVGNRGGNGPPYWAATTPDGKTVTSLRVDMPNIRALAFGGGRFVIVGAEGTRISSADGKTWEAANADKSIDFRWVIWTGKEFLAGGGKQAFSSPDGKAWMPADVKPTGNPLWTDGTRFISTSWPGQMYYSPDGGKTWEKGEKMTANGINKATFGETK